VTTGCAGAGVATRQVAFGDYELGSPGALRRIVVSRNRPLSYDIWRAAPNGKFDHLHYVLTPPGKRPIEPADYQVRSDGRDCDSVYLYYYRDRNFTHNEVLVLRYGGFELPFGSAARPLTPWNSSKDAKWIAALNRSARNPKFYGSLKEDERAELLPGVPQCR
jgi:hypothetical protein